jgi:hypothetical protein
MNKSSVSKVVPAAIVVVPFRAFWTTKVVLVVVVLFAGVPAVSAALRQYLLEVTAGGSSMSRTQGGGISNMSELGLINQV